MHGCVCKITGYLTNINWLAWFLNHQQYDTKWIQIVTLQQTISHQMNLSCVDSFNSKLRNSYGPQAISDVDIGSKTLALQQFSPHLLGDCKLCFNWIPFRNVIILHAASYISWFSCINICIEKVHRKGSFLFDEWAIQVFRTLLKWIPQYIISISLQQHLQVGLKHLSHNLAKNQPFLMDASTFCWIQRFNKGPRSSTPNFNVIHSEGLDPVKPRSSGLWLNQPIWKKCSSQILDHFPQMYRVK